MKEMFIPTTVRTGGVMVNHGYYPVARLVGSGQDALMSFFVPDDWEGLISAQILVIPLTNGAPWDIFSSYGMVGEIYNIHEEEDTTSGYTVTENEMYAVDAKGILTGIQKYDKVGVMLMLTSADYDTEVIGLRLNYEDVPKGGAAGFHSGLVKEALALAGAFGKGA